MKTITSPNFCLSRITLLGLTRCGYTRMQARRCSNRSRRCKRHQLGVSWLLSRNFHGQGASSIQPRRCGRGGPIYFSTAPPPAPHGTPSVHVPSNYPRCIQSTFPADAIRHGLTHLPHKRLTSTSYSTWSYQVEATREQPARAGRCPGPFLGTLILRLCLDLA